ncbi:hypothetical protein BB561_005689 [Smittium simulii]|uniref:diphthine methyl ester synthase n=1 Tax=Smittium simulii TaxID=133385 RepID=A0A2T9Y900_9FUNG|nr:hypothetical protein BB561_005689 [Smittium simulii]
MLYIIGLGLADEYDITLKGLNAIKQCERVYLEAYTSMLLVGQERLESLYEKKVIIADREMVEQQSDEILQNADKINVAFLVVGDPFGATTHTDLVLRANELGIEVKAIHNSSIMNAIGATGLQLYNFGQTISMVFFTESWRPDSWYEKIKENSSIGLHTLCLLDIKVKEQSIENLARGRKIYEPPRYMTTNQAISQLLEIEQSRNERAYTPETVAVAVARIGADSQKIAVGSLKQLQSVDMGEPLHSLVLVGCRLHILEAEILRSFAVDLPELDKIFARDFKMD